MSTSHHPIDEFVLDELVSGNLRGEEYRRVLRTLDAHPEKWRDCAIAFLQEQAIAQELQALAKSPTPWQSDEQKVPPENLAAELLHSTPDSSFATQEHEMLSVSPANLEWAQPVEFKNTRSEAGSMSQLQWMHRVTSIAALLLISFTIGWFGSGLRGSLPSPPAGNEGSELITQNDLSPKDLMEGTTELDGSNGAFQFAGNSFVPIDRQLPESIREMERRGRVQIEVFEAFMPMELKDGSSAIMPVQQYRVRPTVVSY